MNLLGNAAIASFLEVLNKFYKPGSIITKGTKLVYLR